MSVKLKELSEKINKTGIPVELMGNALLINGESLKVLRKLPSNSIDSGVIDGPYGIGFIGKDWDNFNPKALSNRSRNYQEGLDCNLQTGRSPSMHAGQYDISRRGAVRYQQWCYEWAKEVYRVLKYGAMLLAFCSPRLYHRQACAIEDAGFQILDQIQYIFGSGFPKTHDISKGIDKLFGAEREIVGENLNRKGRKNWDDKPKNITLPATEQAKYWDGWQTALKPSNEPIVLAIKPILEKSIARNVLRHGVGGININVCRIGKQKRFPANTIISEEIGELLGDKAKFFYAPKVSKKERNAGCEHLVNKNHHPTVKNLALTEYLVSLVTPKNGVCLDIFMGSGTCGIACSNLDFGFIGVERQEEYFEIAKARISHWQNIKKAA